MFMSCPVGMVVGMVGMVGMVVVVDMEMDMGTAMDMEGTNQMCHLLRDSSSYQLMHRGRRRQQREGEEGVIPITKTKLN